MAGKIKNLYDIEKVKSILPQRYPFLMIDKVIEYEEDDKLVAIKNVSFDEWFFQGHFPDYPVMPGVLVLEAMAQAGCIAAKLKWGADSDKTFFLAGADKFKWRREVRPGDTLKIEMSLIIKKSFIWKIKAVATVDDKVVADGILTAAEK